MNSAKNEFGVQDPMTCGLAQQKSSLEAGHPVEVSEKSYDRVAEARQMEHLRSMQGLHAPLRIQMERRAVQRAGHLPCMTQRSSLLDDVITGKDETIAPSDLFGKPENFEGLSTPHAVLEKHFKM